MPSQCPPQPRPQPAFVCSAALRLPPGYTFDFPHPGLRFRSGVPSQFMFPDPPASLSFHPPPKNVPRFVGKSAISVSGHRDDIFLYLDRVIEIPLSSEELLQPDDHVVRYFPLSLSFRVEDHKRPVAITYDGNGTLAERIEENGESVSGLAVRAHAGFPIWSLILPMMDR